MNWKLAYISSVAGIVGLSALTIFVLQHQVVPVQKKQKPQTPIHYSLFPLRVATTTAVSVDPADATTTINEEAQKHRFVHDPVPLAGEHAVRVPILMYHYIREFSPKYSPAGNLLSVTPESFEQQMQEISDSGFQTISPEELYAAIKTRAPLPKHPVLITFDDGYRDQYQSGYPSLIKHQLRATFFIISTYLHYSGYMTAAMLKEMDGSGLMTIAAHTRHHAPLTKIATSTAMDEIAGSKQDLETVLGHPVEDFAYPYGYVNGTVKQMTEDAGYRLGFSTLFGSLQASSSSMELRRIRVRDGEDLGPLLRRYGQ